LDLEIRFLRRGEEEVTLRPKSFQLLVYLVERHGQLVSKSELIDAVWPDASITDNSLAQCLIEIRRALADEDQSIVRTVKGRGYVFTAAVTTPVIPFAPVAVESPPEPVPGRPGSTALNRWKKPVIAAVCAALVLAGGLFLVLRAPRVQEELKYTQLTDLTDSAIAPALSPDGRMVAFFRSDDWWLTTDPIYIQMIPGGEPVKLTNDDRQKCCIAFSADGLRVAYSLRARAARLENVHRAITRWRTQAASIERHGTHLVRSTAASVLGNPDWLSHGNRRGEGTADRLSPDLLSEPRSGDGSLLVRLTRPEVGSPGGDGS
jgi:DNA-binding winged helix-turn-helix (wHTH) protein